MPFNYKKTALLLTFTALFFSCSTTEIPLIDPIVETITYTADVKTIMDTSCATSGCHSGSSPASGLDLSTYNNVKNSAQNGSFYTRIGNDSMPLGSSPLPAITKAILDKWKTDGYLEN